MHSGRVFRWTMGGFTLVELLMVITVLIIAAAIVIPNIGSAADAQAMSAARALASDLELARHLALKTAQPHTVLFSDDLQSYKVVSGKTFEVTLSARNGMGAVTVASASFGGDAYVTFNELGEPSSAGEVTVEAGDLQIVVAVAGLTGSVSTTRVGG